MSVYHPTNLQLGIISADLSLSKMLCLLNSKWCCEAREGSMIIQVALGATTAIYKWVFGEDKTCLTAWEGNSPSGELNKKTGKQNIL